MTRDKPTTNDEPKPQLENQRPPFISPHADVARCHFCERAWAPEYVDGFDLSSDDEYYPRMVPVCPEHSGGCR